MKKEKKKKNNNSKVVEKNKKICMWEKIFLNMYFLVKSNEKEKRKYLKIWIM